MTAPLRVVRVHPEVARAVVPDLEHLVLLGIRAMVGIQETEGYGRVVLGHSFSLTILTRI